ncbi:MAG: nuclear transport factor 2 family protein [Anaerolineales bacterium]
MQADDAIAPVRDVLHRFQDGYTARNLSELDEFMTLFDQSDNAELIGIGASVRGGNEWFQGAEQIREIVASDWSYWGDVSIDVENAKITVLGDVAWLSTSGELVQTQHFDEALRIYLDQMKEMLEDERLDLDMRLMEATHFGMRRLRERHLGQGHTWPFVFTAVLKREKGDWRFHTIHWSMPVD